MAISLEFQKRLNKAKEALGTEEQRQRRHIAMLYPQQVIEEAKLIDPEQAEIQFHLTQCRLPRPGYRKDGYDPEIPIEEQTLKVVPFDPSDARIEMFNRDHGVTLIPKTFLTGKTDENGRPIPHVVNDWVRPNGRLVGVPDFPVEAAIREVKIPDVMEEIAALNVLKTIRFLKEDDTPRLASIGIQLSETAFETGEMIDPGRIAAICLFARLHPDVSDEKVVSEFDRLQSKLAKNRALREKKKKH